MKTPIKKSFKKGPPVAKGTSKDASSALFTPNHKPGTYLISVPRNSQSDYIIVNIKKGKANEIYDELQSYYDFGKRGISPIIYSVKVPGEEPLTLEDFLTNYKGKNIVPESYLVEKSNCGGQILEFYENDMYGLFSNLRKFIADEIVANGFINTDIKLDNLCVDNVGNFKMIDLDPNFFQKIQRGGISVEDYINYMLFQVYVNMCTSGKMQHDYKFFFSLFSKDSLIRMIENIFNFQVTNERTHPLRSLLWYNAKMKNKNRFNYLDQNNEINSNYLYTEIFDSLKPDRPLTNADTSKTLEPTYIPTEPLNMFSEFSTPNVRIDYGSSERYVPDDLSGRRLFENESYNTAVNKFVKNLPARGIGGKGRGRGKGKGKCKTKKFKKKLRRNKSTRR